MGKSKTTRRKVKQQRVILGETWPPRRVADIPKSIDVVQPIENMGRETDR